MRGKPTEYQPNAYSSTRQLFYFLFQLKRGNDQLFPKGYNLGLQGVQDMRDSMAVNATACPKNAGCKFPF